MRHTILVILLATSTFLCSGCIDKITEHLDFDDKPQVEAGHQESKSKRQTIIDKGVKQPHEVKIGEVSDALHNEWWNIYLLPASVEFETTSPAQFRCQVRIVSIEDEAVPALELKPRLDTYEFFQHGSEMYYRCINYLGWRHEGKVAGAAFAERIFAYVSKNM